MRQKKKSSLDLVKVIMNSYGKKQRRLNLRSVLERMGGNQQRAKQNCKNHGFTLIEVLISISLLSVLLGVTFVATNVFMAGRQKGVNIVKERWSEFRNYSLMKSVLESTYDYYVKTHTRKHGTRVTISQPFFHGRENQLEFITLSSIYERHKSVVATIYFAKERDEKTGRLIYHEASLQNRIIEYDNDKIEYGKELILISGIKQVTFRYYGRQDQEWDTDAMVFDAIYGWSPTFFGREKGVLPEKVELLITYENGKSKEKLLFQLPDNNMKKKTAFVEQESRRNE